MAEKSNNRFFASYNRGTSGWSYIMGNFAQMSLPLTDSATLTIQRVGSNKVETITVRGSPSSDGEDR